MVERFVEAVLRDDVAVNAILALTFTEKAAGELRDRLRRRLLELGETDRAREADGAWVGTIHGFCARVLRAEPLAAGLDPRFGVLDEATAQRLASQAWDAALDGWAGAHGEPALALAGAYGSTLETLVLETHAALRSAGQTTPRLPRPAPEVALPDSGDLSRARVLAAEALAGARAGVRVERARAVLTACEQLLAGCGPSEPVPVPGALEAARLAGGTGALAGDECAAYREAFERYAQACADHHARAALELLDDLLSRFDSAYAAAKRRRGSLDFADLELFARDLFARSRTRRARWSDRFALLMIDEFQDTNRVQLDILEALERDNLFAVGDELQSIYGFRHADVTIFRERRASLPAERIRRLTANFRSRQSVLDVLNGVFAPVFGERFSPLRAGRRDGADGQPGVELLITDARGWEERESELGLTEVADQPWRRAEARALAERIAGEVEGGRPAGEVVVLVRSTASLRLFEQALEERGVPTYVLGGRGYWSHEQVRDGLAYLSALANPLDEVSLLGALASPFCGAGSDALVTLAEAGRRGGAGLWSALQAAAVSAKGLEHLDAHEAARLRAFAALLDGERERAERDPPEVLLERAVLATGYDLAILARAGGDRRMANLRKLMRLAREYDANEGRDLRGFITYALRQDLREAREGEAPLEAEDLDAVRLMTIHRAKGLEFPVVAVADLGRQGGAGGSALLVARDGRIGLRLATLGAGSRVDALDYRVLADEQAAAEDEEERRLLYVAMTRAEELLIVSGGVDPDRLPSPRPGGAPIAWILPALLDQPADAIARARASEDDGLCLERIWDGRPVQTRVLVNAPDALLLHGSRQGVDGPRPAAPSPRRASRASSGAVPRSAATPGATPARAGEQVAEADAVRSRRRPAATDGGSTAGTGRSTPVRLSYTALQDYARCPYRFYLQRRLRLPSEPLAEGVPGEQLRLGPAAPAVSAGVRGVVAHRLLEELDFAAPRTPTPGRVRGLLREEGACAHAAESVEDLRAMVAGFAASRLCARLARATPVRREAPFAFAARPGSEPLVSGVLDVHAVERDDGVLVVDYKTDRLGDRGTHDVVESEYTLQRAVYALAVLASGAERVEVAYCFLERPEDVVASQFAPADVPSLSDVVLTAAAGVLEGRWPVAAAPHRGLCGDCPGRRALCSHPEELTLRENAGAHGERTPSDRAATGSADAWPDSSLRSLLASERSAGPEGSSTVWSSGAAADTEV
jgi:ATP-dependent helicase/nuclease subunit A